MTPETDPKKIAAKLCEFARTNFVAEGVEFDENSPLSQAGIDSFALVELVLFCERVLGVRVPDSHLTGANLASMSRWPTASPNWRATASLRPENLPARRLCLTCPVKSAWPPAITSCTGRIAGCGRPVCRATSAARSSNWANGFDVERLRRRIAASPIMDWLARARIFRPLPMLFPPLWRTSAKPKTNSFRAQRSKWRRGKSVVAAENCRGTRTARRPRAGTGLRRDAPRGRHEPFVSFLEPHACSTRADWICC